MRLRECVPTWDAFRRTLSDSYATISSKTDRLDGQMTRKEFERYIEQTFDSFFKKVGRNAAIDIHREIKRQREREKSLSDLSESELESLSITDNYELYTKEYDVLGETVIVRDADVGEALLYLQPQLRNIVLMRYFLDKSNNEIADKLHISKSTVAYRLAAALKQLKEQMKAMNDMKPV